ncbi:MAG: thiolase family protein [Archaeoglobi archaeon]|nr:thiolase family protein [Archaeoglobi archaeon]
MRVGITGIGMTSFGVHEEPFYNVAYEAAKKAMEDSGIERHEIDNVVLGGYDVSVGRTISNMYAAPASGGYLKDEIRVSDDAAYALALAYMRIKSGIFDVAMVLGYGHCSESPMELVELLTLDPFFHRDLGLSYQMSYAMQSYAYKMRYGIKDEVSAEVVVKARKRALKYEYAHLRNEVTVDDVLSSEMAVFPLRRLELPPWSDGCVALILAEETVARRMNPEPIWIEGLGWNAGNYYLGSRNLVELSSTRRAAQMAYRMAGCDARGVDAAEVMDLTPYHHLMSLEALGFAEDGEGKEAVGTDLPVNRSGGALCTNAHGTTGLFLTASLALQIREGADRGVASAVSGYAAQNSIVTVLGAR